MSLQITSTTPPTEPVAVADVKARLRLTTTADDATIALQITAAREFAEKVTRRSLCFKSYAYIIDRFPFPHEPIRVPVPPLIAVTGITFLDCTLTEQTWDPADYFIAGKQSPALIVPVPGIIYPPTAHVPGAVEIDFTAGYGYPGVTANPGATPPVVGIPAGPVCPQHIAEGICKLAVHLYEHPESVTAEGLKEAPAGFTALFGANKVYVF